MTAGNAILNASDNRMYPSSNTAEAMASNPLQSLQVVGWLAWQYVGRAILYSDRVNSDSSLTQIQSDT